MYPGPQTGASVFGPVFGKYGTGQYVFDLPVCSEISVKGGKGIWGMPKHQANLDFIIPIRQSARSTTKTGSSR